MENQLMTTESRALVQPQGADLLTEFAAYLDVKEITEKSYGVCLKCFAGWAYERGLQVDKAQREDIVEYARYLASPHPRRQRADRQASSPAPVITFSAGTQARYLRAVKMLYRWAYSTGRISSNPADNVKGAKIPAGKKRDALQPGEARALLDSIDRSTPAGKRDYAMVLLAITAGLRIIEMQRANIGNIETINGERVLFIQGKGHDEADDYMKLTPEVYSALKEYLDTRRTHDAAAPLFGSIGTNARAGETRLTEPSISRIIKRRMQAAGYDTHRLSAHSLRHTSITLLLKSGATLQEAQHHGRHRDITTTEQNYAHNLDKEAAHNEQRIYNFIFDRKADPASAAADCMRRMTAAQQTKALELLQAIAG